MRARVIECCTVCRRPLADVLVSFGVHPMCHPDWRPLTADELNELRRTSLDE